MTKKLTIKTANFPVKKTSVLVMFAHEGNRPEGEADTLFIKSGLDWDALKDAATFTGKRGQVLDVLAPPNLDAKRLLIVGAGPKNDKDNNASEQKQSPLDYAKFGGKLLATLQNLKAQKVALILDGPELSARHIAQLISGMHLRHYSFDKYMAQIKDDDAAPKILSIVLHVTEKRDVDKATIPAMARTHGTLLARDLVNEPPNVLGPVEFAKAAKSLSSLGVEVEILTPTEMKKLGMESLLCVGQGSTRPSRLAIMTWNGGKKSDQPIAFVGKGVVFDTGGISIKPAGGMQDMKGDMGGAAAVTGLMKTLALRKAKVNVVGVIGLAENMPDGNAVRPGDIVKAMSGTTIEIINTDAEGRLVLADALWYTQDRFKPKFMINLATLTGAIMVALGQDYAGLFSNDDELAQRLSEAGNVTGEKLWRMPLGPAYDKLIKSRFADIKNTGGRFGGASTAAQFLQRFVNDVPWAHLDIAGTGFGTPASDTNKSWTSGFGVAVLDQLIADHYED